jgi:hypothetical protein
LNSKLETGATPVLRHGIGLTWFQRINGHQNAQMRIKTESNDCRDSNRVSTARKKPVRATGETFYFVTLVPFCGNSNGGFQV